MIRISMHKTLMAALAAAFLVAGCGPSTPEELLATAKQELAKNDGAAAVIHLRNALQKNPDLGEVRFLLGKALLENGELVAAEKELRKAVELKYPTDQAIPVLARAVLARSAEEGRRRVRNNTTGIAGSYGRPPDHHRTGAIGARQYQCGAGGVRGGARGTARLPARSSRRGSYQGERRGVKASARA